MSTARLEPEEAKYDGDALVEATLMVERALLLWPTLRGEPRLRALTLRCDLGGNDDEFAAWSRLAADGLPPMLTRLGIDRSRHWDDRHDDELALDGARLGLELDDPSDAGAVLVALAGMLGRATQVRVIELCSLARGGSSMDRVLAMLTAAGPWLRLETLALDCVRRSGRDWIQWLEIAAISELIAGCPNLIKLSLPRAALTIDRLEHSALRELEIGWLGCAPLGPTDSREWPLSPAPRGSGLEFLRTAQLPGLARLGVDFQYDWYVGWQVADIAALCEANGMPRLTWLELRYCSLGDELLRRLVDAPWAAQLERLEVIGVDFDAATAAVLVAARPRFMRLRELWCFRPHQLDDDAWRSLCGAYDVRRPD